MIVTKTFIIFTGAQLFAERAVEFYNKNNNITLTKTALRYNFDQFNSQLLGRNLRFALDEAFRAGFGNIQHAVQVPSELLFGLKVRGAFTINNFNNKRTLSYCFVVEIK